MSLPEAALVRVHEDAARLLEAVNATAAATGFATRLIEKDYFCTVLLQYLAPLAGALVFKGGTCLAKVHAGFYRLSEDLDFVIPTPVGASRTERSRRARGLKGLLAGIDGTLAWTMCNCSRWFGRSSPSPETSPSMSHAPGWMPFCRRSKLSSSPCSARRTLQPSIWTGRSQP